MRSVSIKRLAFPRFRRGTLTEQAMESLLGLLHQGKLKPGDRLPSQRELSSMMGLSATVVREAMHGLAGMKVINIAHGRGAYVSHVSAKDLIRPEALLFVMQRETLLQAIEVRGILEVEAMALASERATPADLLEMERILQRIDRAIASGNDPLMHSPSFHMALAEATHNPVLAEIIRPFVGLMARAAKVISNHVAEAVQRELESHKELFEAIRSRDPEKARASMRAHLEEAKRLVSQGYTEEVAGKAEGQTNE